MMSTPRRLLARLALCGLLAASPALLAGAERRFFDDDPLSREPDSQDASNVQAEEIDLIVDFAIHAFGHPGDPAPDVRARNVNTIDEVPDSNWFTNRLLTRSISAEDVSRGPVTGSGPAPGPWAVVSRKLAGAAPGFTIRDAGGDVWFVSFDAAGHPEAATGAIMVANKIFWALGYWQVENHLVTLAPDRITISEEAKFTPPSGRERRMERRDLDDVFARAHRSADGTYRAVAARAVPGRPLGGFRYHGTRPDDPNDVVPHEHRRELRALKVFGAWTNLSDMKAGNTLDTVVTENGRNVVRHYLQDVGSTFGTGANGPHDYDEGWEPLFDRGLTAEAHGDAWIRLRALADGAVCGASCHRAVRRRPIRSGGLAAPRRAGRVPAGSRRRQLLGGPARGGVQRRDDSRRRPGGRLLRSGRRRRCSPMS